MRYSLYMGTPNNWIHVSLGKASRFRDVRSAVEIHIAVGIPKVLVFKRNPHGHSDLAHIAVPHGKSFRLRRYRKTAMA